jgi:hypothetical protein
MKDLEESLAQLAERLENLQKLRRHRPARQENNTI